MAALSGVQATQPVVRDLRPEEDLALLQSYELVEAYDLQEQRMIRPVSVRDDGLYGTPRGAPVPGPVMRTEGPDRVVPAPSGMPDHGAAARPVVPAPRLAPPLGAEHSTTMIEKPDAPGAGTAPLRPAQPEGDAAGDPPALPYGADMGRIRRLVDDLIDGREQVPLPFQYRQAGDLVAAHGDREPVPPSVRRVAAVYKAF